MVLFNALDVVGLHKKVSYLYCREKEKTINIHDLGIGIFVKWKKGMYFLEENEGEGKSIFWFVLFPSVVVYLIAEYSMLFA